MTLKYHYPKLIASLILLLGTGTYSLAQTSQSTSRNSPLTPPILNAPPTNQSIAAPVISATTAPNSLLSGPPQAATSITPPITQPDLTSSTSSPKSNTIPFTASSAYKDCTTLANSNPQMALDKANEWLKIDDSVAAHHCRAMALYGLKRYEQAASELEIVRAKIDASQISIRSYVARQGARAWIDASKPQNALNILTEQINDMTENRGDNATQAQLTTELLLDRGRIREQYGQYSEAVQDFDQAISLSPSNEDVLIERAKVFSQLGDSGLALRDLQIVLRFNPHNTQALGLVRVLRDIESAKKL